MPIGLVEASGEAAALFRARSKLAIIMRGRDVHDIVVRPARDGSN